MGIKVTKLVPATTMETTEKPITSEATETESFQDVLVLNQNALRAMAIDAMVQESSTGSVHPDSVDAAAVMKFRATLGANIKAPIPDDDWNPGIPQKADLGTPQKVNLSSHDNTTTSTNASPSTEASTNVAATNTTNASLPANVRNTGVLECNSELNSYFLEAANTYDLDVNLLKCVAYAESNFNPEATSRSGAMGVMQLMPKTAEGLGVTNAYDAKQNIMGGAKYLSIQLERFDGNVELALAAYNAGPGNVQKYNGIPPFEETQNYVKKIMGIYTS